MSENKLKKVEVDLAKLGKYYSKGWNDKGGSAASFVSQDSNYRVYKPEVRKDSAGTWLVSMKQDHIRGGAVDDHSLLTLAFYPDRTKVGVSATWEMGSDGTIPETTANIIADVVGGVVGIAVGAKAAIAVGAPAMAAGTAAGTAAGAAAGPAGAAVGGVVGAAGGVAVAVGAGFLAGVPAAMLARAVTLVIGNHYNAFARGVIGLTDKGGRLNFNAVIAHNTNKLWSSVVFE